MKLLEQIDLQYEQAIRNLQSLLDRREVTAQVRYDRKKAIALRGVEPKRYTAGIEKQIHELKCEKRLVLKGIEATADYLFNQGALSQQQIYDLIGDIEGNEEIYPKNKS